MTIKIYQKTALMHAVQFDGTQDNAEEIIAFMRDHRGMMPDGSRRAIGFMAPLLGLTVVAVEGPNGVTPDEINAARALFQGDVKAVLWNDLHRYWNPLRITDHVSLDAHGCFYCISDADVNGADGKPGSYMEVGEK